MTQPTPTAEQWAEIGRACQALAVALQGIAKELTPVEGSTVKRRPEQILVVGPTRDATEGWVSANRESLWRGDQDTRVVQFAAGVDRIDHLRGRQWHHAFIVGSHLPAEVRDEVLIGLRLGENPKIRVAATIDRLRPDWRDS